MKIPFWQVDAFTNQPLAGNPAAICVLERYPDAGWLQRVAAEMNLSETAFLVARPEGFDLRWFTPAVEVDLCGHATVASAHALWEGGLVASESPCRFHSRSGWLTAFREGTWIGLDFPAKPVTAGPPPEGMLEALGCRANFTGRNQFDYLVEVDSEDTLRSLQPDQARLGRVQCRGVIVTARARTGSEFDFVSRFFAPAAGIAEDPVTGSAHCCLGPFWSERLGKTEMRAYQASRRGGVVGVRCRGDRVHLLGEAVTVVRGELVVAP
jgi:predicted PhzF superfamily epimerase YddE/YHI9